MHDLCGCILLLSVALGRSAWLLGRFCQALPHRKPLSSDTEVTGHTPYRGAVSLDTHWESCISSYHPTQQGSSIYPQVLAEPAG